MMPSKTRWALNPRKWFGAAASSLQKKDKNKTSQTNATHSQTNSSSTTAAIPVAPSPAPPAISTTRLSTGRQRAKVSPAPIQATELGENRFQNETSFNQYQMPAFAMRRETSSGLISPSKWAPRSPALVTAPTEPSIRKKIQTQNDLFVDGTRPTPMISSTTNIINFDCSKVFTSSNSFSQVFNSPSKFTYDHMDLNVSNLSNQCLVSFPQVSNNQSIERGSLSSRTRSSSSLEDLEDGQESTSSGVFTDERTDLHDGQRAPSKDTLSTTDARSIESIFDSQISLNQYPIRPGFLQLCRSGRMTTTEERPTIKIEATRTVRCHSVEGILKDTRSTVTVTNTKNRQTSAAIVKKIERRTTPTVRAGSATIEKSGFIRINHDTYRIALNKKDKNQRRFRQNSLIDFAYNDDISLPAALEEENYADLPRASSSEQLNQDHYTDIRAMVDDFLRPAMTSVVSSTPVKRKASARTGKSSPRTNRFTINQQQATKNIDQIAERLASSVNSSIYTQYQRCSS